MFTSDDLTRVREDFYLRGQSVASWARDHGFDPNMVYQVLSGRCHARRGSSHQIAQALGLKPPMDQAVLRMEAPTSQEAKM
ncbi:DNA-binding protein [Paucibacter sp. PLA-PC-4]|nr:DNA-binding protein [Paucibacter sp. PLA-PC-4]